MTIDLHSPEAEAFTARLRVIETTRSKIGGHDEYENTTQFDPTTGKFYAVEWWDCMTCRGSPVSSGYTADEIPATPALAMLLCVAARSWK